MTIAAIPCALADQPQLRDSTGTTLQFLPAGRFEMGAADLGHVFYKDHSDYNGAGDEQPIHPVVLTKPFYLAATEVTVGQFKKFVEETGYRTTAEKSQKGIVGWDPTPPANNPKFVATFRQKPEFTWKSPGFAQQDSHPVVGVSLEDAKAYCAWLSKTEKATYRLPTEAEWEYAARAGTTTAFSFGDAYRGVIHKHANLGNVELEKAFPDRVRRQWLVDVESDPPDRHVFTAPVGSYEATPWKLHDMAGNVWEWCEDRYLDTYYEKFKRANYQMVRTRAIDPRNDEKWNDSGDWRVIRGGSWFNAPIQCRASHRSFFDGADAACFLGFRVVREASPHAIADATGKFEKSEAARAAVEKMVGGFREQRDGRLTIRFRRDQMTPELSAALRELDEPVDLYVDGQFKLTGEDVAALAKTPQLRGLGLGTIGQKFGDADLAPLAGHPELEVLQVNENQSLTDAVFEHLTQMKRLEILSLQGEAITDAGLSRIPDLSHIRTLYLWNTQATGAFLAKAAGAPLESLQLGKFSDENAPLLRKFPMLRELRLSGSPITRTTLAELANLPRLQSIDLDRCERLADEDFAALAGCYLLSRLGVEKTAAGDAAAAAFAGFNNLTDLRIGSDRLTDAGMRKLCEIVSLRSLSLSSDATNVTDAGFRDLWRLVNLNSLDVNASQVTGTGLVSLRELPQLRTFSISSPALTDAGVRAIARSESLEHLTLGGWQTGGATALTDESLKQIAGAKSLKQLQFFRKNTAVTDGAVETLRKERPKVNVTVR